MEHISFETARRLKEIGWERETHFVWALPWGIERPNSCKDGTWFHCCPGTENTPEYGPDYSHPIAAPLAEELLEVLPKGMQLHDIVIEWCGKEWEVAYVDSQGIRLHHRGNHSNLAESLALLLIDLVEQGVVPVEGLSYKKHSTGSKDSLTDKN